MPSAEERERSERADQGTSGGAALPKGYLDDVSRVAAIYEALGGLREVTASLKVTTGSHAEEIKQLTQQVYAIPYIKEEVAKNTKDLNEFGRRNTKELNDLGQRLDNNVNELEKEKTKNLNELGIRLGKEIGDLKSKDIGDLKSKMHTAENLFRIFLGILVVVVPLIWIYLSHHVSIVFRP